MAFQQRTLDDVFQSFSKQTIMVMGDLMLDQYIFGKANRISPEAPVPVLEFEQEANSLGGAANVALNIKALGAKVIPVGVVGEDDAGVKILELFGHNAIATEGVFVSRSRITTVKTRIMAAGQQLLRLDKEMSDDLNGNDQAAFISLAIEILKRGEITGLVFQDYNKGVLSDEVISKILGEASKLGIPVTVDPKFHAFWTYKGVDIFKPNLKEVVQILAQDVKPDLDSLRRASKIIRERLGAKAILITLSEKGVFYDDGIAQEIVQTKSRLLADPCGAGDTVISVATLAVTTGLSIHQLAQLANLAGGQVVESSGVVAVDKEQLFNEALQHKILG